MLKSYNPPDIPSVPSLNNELIERCSKPFEKQLSASDLKDSQSRLTISKSDAENHLYPLLNEGENLARRIEVNTCGPDGKQFGMMFKIWGGKTHVLFGKWRAFYNEYDLQSHQDFVTVWMFRRRDTRTLCFDDQVEKIALFSTNPVEKTGE
ncbi:B3 domain-containing protein [Salix suchowensis]|nr:B3 domain-containing protein [Salix suchowensis]